MNVVLFVTVIAWVAVVASAIGLAAGLYSMYHYEYTRAGQLEATIMRVQGTVILGYYIQRYTITLVLSIATLVSIYWG